MPTQERFLNLETNPQLSQSSSFIHAVGLLILSSGLGESLWDITDRVCDRHFGTKACSAPQQTSSATNCKFECACSHKH